MKRWVKITLIISLILNLILIGFQVLSFFDKKERITKEKEQIRRYTEQRIVNVPIEKKKFLDSLFAKHLELQKKDYLFINIWATSDAWTDHVLPIYDTLIEPLLPNVGYITVTDENKKYARSVLKKDTALVKNLILIYSSEDFILAINQELKIPFRPFGYPKYPINIILNNHNHKILFSDTVGISGSLYPEDSLTDRKTIAQIKKALSELK